MMFKRVIRISAILTLVILFLLIAVSCFQPWKAERYINDDMEGFFMKLSYGLPKITLYQDYEVNGTIVTLFLRAHNETTESGNSPYSVFINSWVEKDGYKVFKIHSIEVDSNLNSTHNIFADKNLPIILNYQKASDGLYDAPINSNDDLYLDFDNDEEVLIRIDVSVISTTSEERKILEYKFKPKLEKGYINWITV